MTTIVLNCEFLSQLRRSAGNGFSWSRKVVADFVGDALAEVKERMGAMAATGSPTPESAKEAAIAAFQSLVQDVPREERASVALDEESIYVDIGLQMYYSALVGRVTTEGFDEAFLKAWDEYADSVRDWFV